MKRFTIIVLCLVSILPAYEMNLDSWGHYTVFDPEQREPLLSYPVSWLRPSTGLFDHPYADSSLTYACWDQLLSMYQYGNGYNGEISGNVIAKYIPYSFPQRWSVGLQFINYLYANSTERTDVVMHYQQERGQLEYYHTTNRQYLNTHINPTDHIISADGLAFNYYINDLLYANGSINYNRIEQQDTSSRNYDMHHETAEIGYYADETLSIFANVHYWNYINDDTQGSQWMISPGFRYRKNGLTAYAAMRISQETLYPMLELTYSYKPFDLGIYSKVRSERIDLQQEAHPYMGVRLAFHEEGEHFDILAAIHGTYDLITSVSPGLPNSYGLRINTSCKYKSSNVDLYARGTYSHMINPLEGYYLPERSVLAGGMDFRAPLANGNLLMIGNIQARYILHDDPDSIHFDPSRLTYSLEGNASLVGDWAIDLNLKARIKTFSIGLRMTTPLNISDHIGYYFTEGIYTSSDFENGYTFYAGLNLEWFWWK